MTIGVYILNYNQGRYLQTAIYSVLLQNIEADELLIIDNNSSEDLSKIVLGNARKMGINIKVLSENNFISACNFALNYIQTDYIFRLDADDFLCSNAIEIYQNQLRLNSEVNLIIPSYKIMSSRFFPLRLAKKNESEGMLTIFPPHGAITLINRAAFVSLGGYMKGFDRQDGFMLWLKFFNKFENKIRIISDVLFYYRHHEYNLSGDRNRLLRVRYDILRSVVPMNLLNFKVVFYSLNGENIDKVIKNCSALIELASETENHSDTNIMHNKIEWVQRPINSYYNIERYKRKLVSDTHDYTVFINASYEGGSDAIIFALMQGKKMDLNKEMVLVDRINSHVFMNLDDVHSDSGLRLSDFSDYASFRKIPGVHLIPPIKTDGFVHYVEYFN